MDSDFCLQNYKLLSRCDLAHCLEIVLVSGSEDSVQTSGLLLVLLGYPERNSGQVEDTQQMRPSKSERLQQCMTQIGGGLAKHGP